MHRGLQRYDARIQFHLIICGRFETGKWDVLNDFITRGVYCYKPYSDATDARMRVGRSVRKDVKCIVY